MTHSSGPPPNVAVVASRTTSDRFSSLFPPQSSPITRTMSLIHSPAPLPNVTLPPAPLPTHVLPTHLPSPLTPHLPQASPRMTPVTRSFPSNSVMQTFGVLPNPANSVSRGSHPPAPPAPPTGSRTRWAVGVRSRIVHNISSLQHLPPSTSAQEETLQITAPLNVGEISTGSNSNSNGNSNNTSNSNNNNSSNSGSSEELTAHIPTTSTLQPSSQLPRGPFRFMVRTGRGRGGTPKVCRTPYRLQRHHR